MNNATANRPQLAPITKTQVAQKVVTNAVKDGVNAGINKAFEENSTGKSVAQAAGATTGGAIAAGLVAATGAGAVFVPVASAIGGALGAKGGELLYEQCDKLMAKSAQHRRETGKYMSSTLSGLLGFAIGGPVGAAIAVAVNEATAKRPHSAPIGKNAHKKKVETGKKMTDQPNTQPFSVQGKKMKINERPKSAPLRKGNAGEFRDDIKGGVTSKIAIKSVDSNRKASSISLANSKTKSQGMGE